MRKTEGIKALEKTPMIWMLAAGIMKWALATSESISDVWPEFTGEDPMPWKSNFIVRCEILWFFLHMVDRYAFEIGSPEVRATLQDEIVENVIQEMFIVSFNDSNVKKGEKAERWKDRAAGDMLEGYNEAGLDYSSCKALAVEGGVFSSEGKDTILGKLVARITAPVGQEGHPGLMLLIWLTALEFLVKSRLKEQVRELIEKGKV